MLSRPANFACLGSAGRLRLSGALDLADRAGLEAVVGPFGHLDHVVIDLSAATYIDSTVLGCLCSLHKQMVLNGHAGTITIFGATGNVKRIFELTGLSKVFEIEEIDTDAMTFEIEAAYVPQAFSVTVPRL